VSSSAHIQRRFVTKKAYPAFARPTGLAGYEGDALALRHLPYLSTPTVLMRRRFCWIQMLVLYKFGRCKIVLGREAEGERPISANGKSRACNLLSKHGNSYNAFRGVCCPGAKIQATCVCPHPERQTLRLYDVGMRDQSIEGAGFALKKFHNRLRAAPRLVGRSSAGRNYKLHAAANHYLQNCMQSETWMLAFW
jgi:hypothetical protein